EAPTGGSGSASRRPPALGGRWRGSRCDAGRLRVFGVDEGEGCERRHSRGSHWSASREQAVLEGAARLPGRSRPGGSEAQRAIHSRPDLRVEAEVRASRVRAEDGRRAVAVPGWVEDLRTVDEMPAQRGVPGGHREPRIPGEPWPGPVSRATDQDEDRTRVLRRRTSQL